MGDLSEKVECFEVSTHSVLFCRVKRPARGLFPHFPFPKYFSIIPFHLISGLSNDRETEHELTSNVAHRDTHRE